MAAALVGGAFLSAFLQVLFDRMATPEFLNLFRQRKNDDELLKKLTRNLHVVEAVLDDAENKEIRNPAVKRWLDMLKDVVYEADNLLDQLHTEALRVKIETEYQSSINQVRANTYISRLFNKIQPNGRLIKNIMTMIEKVVKTLDEFIAQIEALGLKKADQVMTKQHPRPPTTSLIDESAIYGRDDDKKKIVEMLLSEDTNGDNFTVVPIVGLGGLGKTTLAQLVYKDETVKNHFSTKAWVCVSEAYDATRITKDLLSELKISFSDSSESFNSLQVKLKDGLTNKRFLLILDDVWNSDYNDWDKLRIPFQGGLQGSKIIVTTRDQNVAKMMRPKEECIHHMGLISEDDCWSLFEKHAFENKDGNQNPELEEIGRKIIKKCGRLPLAVKTVAGLLRSKIRAKEWEDILSSEVWSQSQGGILPALRLSYIHLPSHLKRCFAYCAMFPKDYNFTKENVIQLWLANDLLEHPGDNRRTENMGEECFHELRLRSLFQLSHGNSFTMHDLVNDLATSVSGKYCLRLEDYQQGHGTVARLKNFSYIRSRFDTFAKFEQLKLKEATELRTFLPLRVNWFLFNDNLSSKILDDMLPSFKSLRVLSLCYYRSIKNLPSSFSDLKQLRFLDLSFTSIQELPDWICTLYNLQTLLLDDCSDLKELPADLGKLINLCYLCFTGISLKKMPIQMGRLTNLRVLTAFVVGKDNGSTIEELGKFSKLEGKLFLSGLENVSSGVDASKAMIKDKDKLEDLTLEWKDDVDDSRVARDVLDSLEPYSNIKHLKIKGYCGTSFPNWLKSPSFCHMKSLRLNDCKHCIDLPALGQLPTLESLEIIGMSSISALSNEIYGDSCEMRKPFSSLKILKIKKMQELERWDIPECEIFSNLKELYIYDCPKLIGNLPKQLSSLKILKISGCGKLVLPEDNIQQLSSLDELEISDMENLKELGPGLLNLLASLKELSIDSCGSLLPNLELENCGQGGGSLFESLELWNCDSLKSVSLGSFPTLKKVSISNCESIEMLSIKPPRGIQSGSTLTSLQSLYIWDCHGLISFAERGLPAPNLIDIDISICKSLKSLPKRMDSLLPSLQRLHIEGCPEIECFPEGGLPSTLQYLHIDDCEKLLKSPREWELRRLSSLKSLSIGPVYEESFPNDDWQLPCTLESLSLQRLENLKMLNYSGLLHLTSLQYLCIDDYPLLQSLPDEGLPASLTTLTIWSCPQLQSLPHKGLPSSLTTLEINCCPLLQSLPDEGLPSSLTTLQITQCPLLQSLPDKGLPSSLTTLLISDCPRLKPMLEWEKGRDWHKVAHIPIVLVDWEHRPMTEMPAMCDNLT